jgi:UDP-GlcNAc:undecaprenyl-phosphate GlcNAc-1-phosphate transferase
VEVAEKRPFVAFLVNVSYKRRVFEVLLDVVLIVLAYYAAYRIRFGELDDGLDWQRFFDTLPIIIAVKITVFLFAGMYRGLWRYVTIDDVLVFLKAVVASSIACVLILLFTSRFAGLSRTAFVLDAAILFFLIALTRGSFRVLRVVVRRARKPDHANRTRVLIFGAGDGGEMLLRELENNPVLRRTAVAFYDDDSRKSGKVIRGLSVFGGADDLSEVCTREQIEEVIISASSLRNGRLEEIANACEELGVPLHQLRVTIMPVTEPGAKS